jgi:hypothetical protein
MEKHNGKKVILDGYTHIVKYFEYLGSDGIPHTMISLEPQNKNTKYYQEMKDRLGDHCSTDFKSLSDAHFVDICTQLGITAHDMVG